MNSYQQDRTTSGEIRQPTNRLAYYFMHFVLPIAALAGGIAITLYLLETGPKARPGKRSPTAIVVEVERAESGPQQTTISAMGEIIPAREVEIRPRVSGEIITVGKEFLPGGYFMADMTMLSIDRTDYELVVRQLESEVAKTESDLAIEMGNQRIAEKEFSLLDEGVTSTEKDLILRKPQLKKLQASHAYAVSKLAQARLNLERTAIKAPFNGVLTSRMVDAGAKVTEATLLGTLVGADTFWLRLTLPVDQLDWVAIPADSGETGALVKIFDQDGAYRTGHVLRLIATLEEHGRMAQLLVGIDDPLCRTPENRDKPLLLLGSYVRAEIEGGTIASGIRVDRSYIRDDATIWLMDDAGLLDIRNVTVAFRGREHVIVSKGVRDGERIVISNLASPIPGTRLRLQSDQDAPPRGVSGNGGTQSASLE